MSLTSDQVTDLRRDLGLANDGSVFRDDELERLYERAESDYATTVVYALDQLLVDAAKLNDYKAGSSSESKSQVFKHLQEVRKLWARRAGVGLGTLQAGVLELDFAEKGA